MLTPSIQRDRCSLYHSPSNPRRPSPSHNYYPHSSQLSPRLLSPSPQVKISMNNIEPESGMMQKLLVMKDTVMGLLVNGVREGKVVENGLGECLGCVKNMLGGVARRGREEEGGKGWSEENRRLGLALARIKQAAHSKQLRQTLTTLQRMRQKLILDDFKDKDRQSRLSPSIKLDRNHISRRSQIFDQQVTQKRKFERSTKDVYMIQSELKELKIQMVVLRKEKVKLMMELNREIDISNRKTEEIRVLNGLVGRKGRGREKEREQDNNRMVDRYKSNPKQPSPSTSSQSTNLPSLLLQHQHILHLKQTQILSLLSQNSSLRQQLKQSRQLPFTQSFLSDAFNVKQQIITSNKQQYQKTISGLRSVIFELQNKVDSGKYSEGEEKKSWEETQAEGRSFKEGGNKENNRLRDRVGELEMGLRREEMVKESLKKEMEYLRGQEMAMGLEITYLKGEVGRLKSGQLEKQEKERQRERERERETRTGKSPESLMSSTGFRFRRP